MLIADVGLNHNHYFHRPCKDSFLGTYKAQYKSKQIPSSQQGVFARPMKMMNMIVRPFLKDCV